MTLSYRLTLTLVLSLMALSACIQTVPPEDSPMNYQTDPRILRGIWTGENENGVALTLDLKTKDPTQQSYFSVGTFQLDSGPAIPFIAEIRTPIVVAGLLSDQQADTPTCTEDVSGAVANTFGAEKDLFYDVCGVTPTGTPPEFHMTLTDRNGPKPVTSEFVLVKQPDAPTPEFLVSGTVTRLRDVPYTYDGDFIFTEDSHAIVQLWYVTQYGGEFPAEMLAETTIENITSLPISFKLEGDAKTTFERLGDYYLNVGVFSGDGGATGEMFAVGDLVNEAYTPVPKAGAEVAVEVTGIESCSSPETGGFCVP